MTKYNTVKRKANVGERILITMAVSTEGAYENGDIFTVDKVLSAGVFVKENEDTAMYHKEYEVLVDEPKRIDELESRVSELERQLAQKTATVNTTINVTGNEGIEAIRNRLEESLFGQTRRKPAKALTKSPNEQRKDTIERANTFVAKMKEKPSYEDTLRYMVKSDTQGVRYVCDVEFIVNNQKRTVVALFRWRNSGEVVAKGIAKCAPDDVFNADIGKAIALGRALGVDVTEFENAVKPTEVVVGHKVIRNINPYRGVLTVISDDGGADYPSNETKISTTKSIISTIIDDTEAQYV